jgi:hypothetical protein
MRPRRQWKMPDADVLLNLFQHPYALAHEMIDRMGYGS